MTLRHRQTEQVVNGTDRRNKMVDRDEVRQEDEMEGDCRESQGGYDSESAQNQVFWNNFIKIRLMQCAV